MAFSTGLHATGAASFLWMHYGGTCKRCQYSDSNSHNRNAPVKLTVFGGQVFTPGSVRDYLDQI